MPSTRSSQAHLAAHCCICRVCGKFIKNESIKRHERNCRKRLVNPAPPRRKSCLSCIRAKTRCDWVVPACGICQRKGRSCVYSTESLSSRTQLLNLQPARSRPEKQVSGIQIRGACLDLVQARSATPNVSVTSVEFTFGPATGSFSSLSSEQNDTSFEGFETATRRASTRSDMMPEPLELPISFSSQLLMPKKRESGKVDLIGKLVSRVLCSFPERRMNEDSCPPFIHSSTFRRSLNAMRSEDPIVTCQEVTCNFIARRISGVDAVWDAIASEQERIYDQRNSLDNLALLASAQIVTVYLLMLAADSKSVHTTHPNLPVTVLFTLGSLFERLNRLRPGCKTVQEQSGDRPTWEDWIFAESKLRTATIYFILALHFDVEFGLPCDRGGDYQFEDLELPASKALWEARSEISWGEEIVSDEIGLKYGDLVKSNKRQCSIEQLDTQNDDFRLADSIGEWQKGVDELGMLVSLCSTIV